MSGCLRVFATGAAASLSLNVALFLFLTLLRSENGGLVLLWIVVFVLGFVSTVVGGLVLLCCTCVAIWKGKGYPASIVIRVLIVGALFVLYIPASHIMALSYYWATRHPSTDIFGAIDRKDAWTQEVIGILDTDPASVNAHDPNGNTPLHIAGRRGWNSLARILISRGADVGASNSHGETPLHSGGGRFAELLIANGADVNARAADGSIPLHSATDDCNLDKAQVLIEHKADVNAKNIKGNTALHDAAKWGNSGVVRLLVASGADVDLKNNDGQTALDLAIQQWNMQTEYREIHRDKWEGCINELKSRSLRSPNPSQPQSPPEAGQLR